MRTCVQCERFYFTMGDPGWSEYTPGSDALIACEAKHWEMRNGDEGGRKEFRLNILKAEYCQDFRAASD